MRVAVIQINASANKQKNIAKAFKLCKKAIANGAQFVLLPEVFNYRGVFLSNRGVLVQAETLKGESLQTFYSLAKDKKVFILAGSIIEKRKGFKKVFNTSVLINDNGRAIEAYRKINLFKASLSKNKISESKIFAKGTREKVAKVKNFTVGLSICYDLRFSGLYEKLKKKGANVLCVPSAFTKETGQAHWESLLRARAIENLAYVIAPNQVGQDGRGVKSFGNSMIVDPWGKIISRASAAKEEIIYANLSLDKIKESRKKLPGIC